MHVLMVIAVFIVAVVLYMYLAGKSAPAARIIKALQDGARVIDVRTVREYKRGHYPGAVNIPVTEIAARSKTLGKPSETIVVYCHSGMRSAKALKIMRSKGFKDVINAGSYHNIMQVTSKNNKGK